MQADEALVNYIAATYYEMAPVLGSVKRLPGYDDANFALTDSRDHKAYVLKIVNRQESCRELTQVIDEILFGAHEYCAAKLVCGAGGGGGSEGARQQQLLLQHFVVPRLVRTSGNKLSTYTSVKYNAAGSNGPLEKEELVVCNIRMCELFHGQTIAEFMASNSRLSQQKLEMIYFRLGKLCNQLFVYLRTQVHLVDRLRELREQSAYPWALLSCPETLRKHLDHLYPEPGPHPRRRLVEQTLEEFASQTKPKLAQLPEFVIHSDLSYGNLLVGHQNHNQQQQQQQQQYNSQMGSRENLEQRQLCVIDFQDLQVGQQVAELAILMLYSILGYEAPRGAPPEAGLSLEQLVCWVPRWIYLGYQSGTGHPLNPSELALAPSLMKLRLCQSLLNGLVAQQSQPDNSAYLMQTNRRGWQLLELLSDPSRPLGRPAELAALWPATPT